jgi:DNA polymerase-3 subunit alpha
VQKRRYDETQYEFSIKNIQLLSEMRDLLIKSIKLKIQLQDINREMIEKIESIVSNNKGDCRVNVVVYNKEDNTFVEMPSNKYKINPSNELIASFEKINELTVEYV